MTHFSFIKYLWNKYIYIQIIIVQSKIAPQKLHRRCRHAKQQRMPIGNRNIAQQRPIHVNSLSNMPT